MVDPEGKSWPGPNSRQCREAESMVDPEVTRNIPRHISRNLDAAAESMVDPEVMRNRLAMLGEYIADLQAEQGISLKNFKGDKRRRRYVERTLHLAVESCLDIASHLISAEGLREPRDNKDIFAVLGEANYLPEDLVTRLMKMAQFRNILVHDYTRLDAEVIWGILERDLDDLKNFMLTITEQMGIN